MASGVVLLVEDEEPIAEMLRGFFERDGFRFLHVGDGAVAVDRVRNRPVDAVLLDLNLPRMDGVDVCRRIREFSSVPIIMLTARDGEVDKIVGLELGADDYVTKPFSARELVARVKAVLRRAAAPRPAPRIIDVAGYEVDSGTRSVRCPDGDTIQPTAREFDLLWYMAENKGLALSRSQILSAVWGYDYFGDGRTVDVHVRQLRKKIDGIPIETVWGVGYKLAD